MKSKKCQEEARAIIDYYKSHQNDRKSTINHFVDQGLNARTIRNVLKRYEEEGRVDYNLNSGPKKTVLTKQTIRKIKNSFIKSPSTSCRKVASKLNISEKSVRRGKSMVGIKCRKKIAYPKYVNNQENRCKTNA